jgi:hypothetical protein
MSHVSDASRAFFDATTFNQNIDNWDVNTPTANVLVKGGCAMKHISHISYLANPPLIKTLIIGMLVR